MSVGLDPMVATVHNIKVIDGCHNLYPLSYKRKFREIIQDQLENDPNFKKYFDDWVSRLYSSSYSYHPKNSEELKLNYKKAKNIGAEFIISNINLNS